MTQSLQQVLDNQVGAHPLSYYEKTDSQKNTSSKVNKGRPQTEYAKQVASKTHKGKIVSEETRLKQSIAHRNLLVKHEHAIKISQALKGKRHSAEHRDKLSQAGCGVKKKTMTPMGIFPSRSAAAQAYNVVGTTIQSWVEKYPDQFYYILEQK